jgi:hypothetical protein
MVRPLLSLLLLITIAETGEAGINLTPTPSEYVSAGIKYTQLSFKDGDRRVTFEPPVQWSYRSAGDRLLLLPPKNSRAEAAIQAVPLPAPQAFDEKGIQAARDQFLKAVPPGAQSVVIVSEVESAVPMKGLPNYEFTASYKDLGTEFLRRTLFVNLPETQLVFKFSAPRSEFENLYRLFRVSMLSWEWVEPASTSPGPRTASK